MKEEKKGHKQIAEIIGALIRLLFFVLVGAFFFVRLCGIENALNNLAETQNKIFLECKNRGK